VALQWMSFLCQTSILLRQGRERGRVDGAGAGGGAGRDGRAGAAPGRGAGGVCHLCRRHPQGRRRQRRLRRAVSPLLPCHFMPEYMYKGNFGSCLRRPCGCPSTPVCCHATAWEPEGVTELLPLNALPNAAEPESHFESSHPLQCRRGHRGTCSSTVGEGKNAIPKPNLQTQFRYRAHAGGGLRGMWTRCARCSGTAGGRRQGGCCCGSCAAAPSNRRASSAACPCRHHTASSSPPASAALGAPLAEMPTICSSYLQPAPIRLLSTCLMTTREPADRGGTNGRGAWSNIRFQ